MTERVQIEIEASDNASGILRAIAGQFGALGGVVSDFGTSISANTKFMGLYSRAMKDGSVSAADLTKAQDMANAASARLAETVAMFAIQTLKDSINSTMEYASQVRDLSLASGTSAEEASRLIQVLDDYEITAGQITTATRFLTKNGLEPNIETIAKLADEYVKIQDPMEKNRFIMENLGRGGLQWANALSQGGDKLRALNSTVSENLILNDKQVQQTEHYRLAMDDLSDTWEGFKVRIGTFAIPLLNELLTVIDKNIEAGMSWRDAIPPLAMYDNLMAWKEAHDELNPEIDSATKSYMAMAKAQEAEIKKQEEYKKAVEEANKQLSEQNTQLLQLSEKMTGASSQQLGATAYDQFKQGLMADGMLLDNERAMLNEVGIALGQLDEPAIRAAEQMTQWRQAVEAGTMEEDEYIKKTQALQAAYDARAQSAASAKKPLEELVGMAERLNDATAEQIKQAAYQDLKGQLAEGGMTQQEARLLAEAGVSLGVIDEKSLYAAQHLSDLNTQFQETGDVEAYKKAVDDLITSLDTLNNKNVNMDEILGSDGTLGTGTSGTEGMFGNATGTSGQWVTVPAGYPNDSYKMGLSSGEKYMVQTQAESGAGDTVNNTSAVNNYYGNITMVTDGGFSATETRI